MNLRFLFLLLGGLTALSFAGCDKDDDHDDNEITIRILEPAANAVIEDAANVNIRVEVEATDENHGVEIVLYPDGDPNNKLLDSDLHEHDELLSFEQGIDLSSFPSGQKFHLNVEACVDHDCEEKKTAEVEFSIQ
jgi:hypothetical protein